MNTPKEKRAEERDPGEHEQNIAVEKGLVDAPNAVVEGADGVVETPGKCPTCGRDKVNS